LRPAEKGFLLLTSTLGDPRRRVLTPVQLRTLSRRVRECPPPTQDRDLNLSDLATLGYGAEMAGRILQLLSEESVLEYYLHKAKRQGCLPLTLASQNYPKGLRQRLGEDCPGVLWAKGDLSLLESPCIALVGSRDLFEPNRIFAEEVGRQAALQGYTLVSGNARGADRTAQEACLRNGGRVIIVVADELASHSVRDRVLYLSEESFDLPFSAQRALSRNRVIHALSPKTLVAQCSLETGGTWDGTVKNLRFGWSDVFCFRDGSNATQKLEQMGATLIDLPLPGCFSDLKKDTTCLFDRM